MWLQGRTGNDGIADVAVSVDVGSRTGVFGTITYSPWPEPSLVEACLQTAERYTTLGDPSALLSRIS